MREHGPWRIVASRTVYQDPWLRLQHDDVVRPDGEPGSYIVAHIKPGVCVVPLDVDSHVYLTEEFHYGVGRVTLEGVSGGTEAGETFEETAARELREEIGIAAGKFTHLGVVDPLTSSLVSPTQLYLAEDLHEVAAAPEGTECIRRIRMPFVEAVRRVMDGELTHGPTCVLLLKAWARITGDSHELSVLRDSSARPNRSISSAQGPH